MSTPLQTAQYLLDGDVLDVQDSYDGSNSTIQFIADGDLDGRDAADLSAGAFNIPADLISDDVTSYTFSMWLKPSSFPASGYHYIITDHAHAQNDDSIFIAVNSAGQIGIQHRGEPNALGNHPRDTKFFGVAGSELTVGVWSHIVITWNGTDANKSNWEASLYKDSVHMQTVVLAEEPWDSPHPLFVGYENLGGGDTYHGYQGLMANLNFWDDQVLTGAEVQQVYNDESLVNSSSNSNNTDNTGDNNMSTQQFGPSASSYAYYAYDQITGQYKIFLPGITMDSLGEFINGVGAYIEDYSTGQPDPSTMVAADFAESIDRTVSTEGVDSVVSGVELTFDSFTNGSGNDLNYAFGVGQTAWESYAVDFQSPTGKYDSQTTAATFTAAGMITEAYYTYDSSSFSYQIFVPNPTADVAGGIDSSNMAIVNFNGYQLQVGLWADVVGGADVTDADSNTSTQPGALITFSSWSQDLEQVFAVTEGDWQASSGSVNDGFSPTSRLSQPFQPANYDQNHQNPGNDGYGDGGYGDGGYGDGGTGGYEPPPSYKFIRLKDDWDFSSATWTTVVDTYDPNTSYHQASIPFSELDVTIPASVGQYDFNQAYMLQSDAADQTGAATYDGLSADYQVMLWVIEVDQSNSQIIIQLESTNDPSTLGSNYPGFASGLGDIYAAFNENDSAYSTMTSGGAGGFDYSSISAGAYPLVDIMDKLHQTSDGTRLDKLGTVQMKNRLISASNSGYRPRTMDTGLLLSVNFIENVKAMTCAQALAAPNLLISQDEYDLMVLPEAQGGFGLAADGSDLLPEIPLVMMQDMYRATICRLLDFDENMFFDASPTHAASAMVAYSTQGMPLDAQGEGGLLVAKNDMSVVGNVSAADFDLDGALAASSGLTLRDQSANGHSRKLIITGTSNVELASVLGMPHSFQNLLDLGVLTMDQINDLYLNKAGVPQDVLDERDIADLGHIIEFRGNLSVALTSTFKDLVLAESTLSILDTSSSGLSLKVGTDAVEDGDGNVTTPASGGQADVGANLSVTDTSTLSGNVEVGVYDQSTGAITTTANLDVDLKLDVDGSFMAGDATQSGGIKELDSFTVSADSQASLAILGGTASIELKASDSSGKVDIQVADNKKIVFQQGTTGKTVADSNLTVGTDFANDPRLLTVTNLTQFGDEPDSDTGSMDQTQIQGNLVMDGMHGSPQLPGKADFVKDVEVKADGPALADITLSGDATINVDPTLSGTQSATGTSIAGDLTVHDSEAVAQGSFISLQATVGNDAANEQSSLRIGSASSPSSLKVGDAGVETAVSISKKDAIATYHASSSHTQVDTVLIDATGDIDISSNDASTEAVNDIDILLDADGKVILTASSIEIESANGTVSFEHAAEVKDELVLQLSQVGAPVEAFKMIRQDSSQLTKASITVDDTDPANISTKMVINNTAVSANLPDGAAGGSMSVAGTLKVAGSLFQALNATDEFRAGIGLDVKVFDNILSISHESDQLSWEELDSHHATAGVGTQDAIRAAAVAEFQPEGYDSSESDNSVTAALWSELTPAQLMKVPSDAAYQVDRSSNASYEVPRTQMQLEKADGLHFWLPSSGATHADQAEYLDKPINVGPRAFVVAPGHGDNVGSDNTVMSIVAGTSLDLDSNGELGDTTYLAMQAGDLTLEGMAWVHEKDVTPTWGEMLLIARRYQDGDDTSVNSTTYSKLVYALNDIMPFTASIYGETWSSMTEAEVDAELYAYSNGAPTKLINSVPVMQYPYDGPDLLVDGAKFRVADSTHARLVGSGHPMRMTGKLHIKQDSSATGTGRISSLDEIGLSTSPALHVTNAGDSAPSVINNDVAVGTQDSSDADGLESYDKLTIIDDAGGAGGHIQLKGSNNLYFAPASSLNGRKISYGDNISRRGTLRSGDGTHDLSAHDAHLLGDVQVGRPGGEFQATGAFIGLSDSGEVTTSYGDFEVSHLPSDDTTSPQKSKIAENIEVGDNSGASIVEFDATSSLMSFNALTYDIDQTTVTHRGINSAARAEFELKEISSGVAADALFGGDLGIKGTSKDDLLVSEDIHFGKDFYEGVLKSKAEFLMQDSFTDGTQTYTPNDATMQEWSPGNGNAIKGITLAASRTVLETLIQNGVDVLRTLTWNEAQASGYDISSKPAGALGSDLSGISYVSMMASVIAAQNATAGFTHQERMTSYYQPGSIVCLDTPVHNAIGTAAENDQVAPDSFKGRLEVYLNGLRVPDSEYEVIYSSDAAKRGKQLSFKKPIERRDILIVDSKVANPG